MKTKTKIEIGTTFPYSDRNRLVTAEVTGRRKDGHRVWWQVTLTEGGQPILHDEPNLAGKSVGFDATTGSLGDSISWGRNCLRRFLPTTNNGSSVLIYVETRSLGTVADGLWVEIREFVSSGPYRPTRWVRSEYATVEELLASGDAVEIVS